MFEELYQAAKLRLGNGAAAQSMAEWICANTTIKKRPFSYEGYRFQEAIAADMHPDLVCKKCSQVGLALDLTTPLVTPTGWTTIGDVKVGDQLVGADGRATTVTFKSEIYRDRVCYDVVFDDGSVLRADAAHRWLVKTTRGPFNADGVYQGKGRPPKAAGYAHEGVVNTQFLVDNFDKAKFFIPVAAPLEGDEVELPINPYVYGAWLGDGTRYSATLTIGDQDVAETTRLFAERGVSLVSSSDLQYRMVDQYRRLRELGVLGEAKRIPMLFQRASEAQRLELLRGLMDTDGSITFGGRASFHNTEEGLVQDVQDLLHGLGFKTRTRWRAPAAVGFGGKKQIAEVSFVPDWRAVFNLPRKLERQQTRTARPRFTQNRTIVAINPAPTVPVQCLTVDNADHLFLAGRSLIPTHNTEVQLRKFLAILARNTAINGIFSLPNEKMFTKVYNGRLKPILDTDEIFNPPVLNGSKPTRSKDQIQIRDSFGYMTACTEGDATSITADFLFHDELDLSPQEIIALYQSRLQNSDMKMTQSFSTPTFVNYGIDKKYRLTDQREYVVKCECCNHYQVPRFTPNFIHLDKMPEVDDFMKMTAEDVACLDVSGSYVKCERCQSRLDLANPMRREWVATYPSRTAFRGYQVRPFSTSRLKPAYIFSQLGKYLAEGYPRRFANTVLGEEYTSDDAQIQDADIDLAMAKGTASIPDIGPDVPMYLGIDVGLTCHLTLSHDNSDGLPHFVLFETCPASQLEKRIEDLRKIYTIVQGAVDRFPYTPQADAIRDTTGRLVVPIQYRGQQALQPVFEGDTRVLSHYSASRTSILDRLLWMFSHKAIILSGYTYQKEVLKTHLKDMVRDEHSPDAEAEWKKTTGSDHYFHAMALSLLARRVCEHMYATQAEEVATTTLFVGGAWGGTHNLGPSSQKSLQRISRLG